MLVNDDIRDSRKHSAEAGRRVDRLFTQLGVPGGTPTSVEG